MNEYDRVNEKMNRIVSQLERIADGQVECNRLLSGLEYRSTKSRENTIIIEIEKELTEANEKLVDAAEHERKAVEEAEGRMRGGQRPLTDPFYEDRVINQPLLVYWKRLIENHIKDEKFTSLDHAIVYLVDKYPGRKEG